MKSKSLEEIFDSYLNNSESLKVQPFGEEQKVKEEQQQLDQQLLKEMKDKYKNQEKFGSVIVTMYIILFMVGIILLLIYCCYNPEYISRFLAGSAVILLLIIKSLENYSNQNKLITVLEEVLPNMDGKEKIKIIQSIKFSEILKKNLK